MKPLKKAIRFFEQYSPEECEELLFGLFVFWKEKTNPSLRLEQSVYHSLFDIRSYLNQVFEIVESGSNGYTGFRRLPEINLEIISDMLRECKEDYKA